MRARALTALPFRIWLACTLVEVITMPLATMAIATTLALHGAFTPFPDFENTRKSVIQDVDVWHDPIWQANLTHHLATTNVHMTLLDASGQIIFRDIPGGLSPVTLPGTNFPDVNPLRASTPETADVSASLPPTKDAQISTIAQPFTRVMVMRGGQLIGTALFAYGDRTVAERGGQRPSPVDFVFFQLTGPWRVPIAFTGLTTVLVVMLIAAWFLGRALLRPLAALDQAARRIAAGNLDFDLPTSRINEVAAVGTAFRVMGGALRESLYRQAAVESERRIFITAIVHDLRTPLFSLRGYLEGLATGIARSPQKAAEYLGVCREKVAVLDRLVADLFTFSRMEYLEQAPDREPLELGALLCRAAEGIRPRSEEHGILLTLDGPETACPFEGDGHMLTRAVENLLDNAIRYTPAGGTVSIQWRETPDGLCFSIADTGSGIAPTDLPHLFAPMYRGESSRNRQTGGAGLGLTIARRVLVAHGGDLIAANQRGAGAIFTANLPCSGNAPSAISDPSLPDAEPVTFSVPASATT